ncbi:MalY/PatB family protein [Clostridium sp. Cult2]|uniref:MalY/PatB family protein n=1 Tax=Clostridium sp. Cult2 TaxID=2079003 RepID=UPI001F300ED3|nr:MalY/PatB family protein [Clostridium sp. Cult2]MCF6466290.1 cystathionine beta-lyase [Clostridium sp. Cult2]
MKYNFDEVVERRNTNCMKWDGVEEKFGNKDVIPMWVADMDFKSPKPVMDAIIERAKHGIFGYTRKPDSYDEAIINWYKKRHNWSIDREWLSFSPGVVAGLTIIIRAFTHLGDQVIIQTPVYYPFYDVIRNNGCTIVENPLKFEGDKYVMDYEDLEEKVKDPRVKLLILCSPHNPVGRVWTKEELTKLGEICIENDVMVVADEIHCDLIYKGYKHTSFASISDKFAQNSITTIAPSKTFNIAGLQASSVVIPNEKLLIQYNEILNRHRTYHINVFALVAVEAAYRHGEDYVDQLMEYLERNLNYLIDFIDKNIPQIKVIKPEGTYLIWLDCRDLGMDINELNDLMVNKAGVAFDDGYWFGDMGNGFMRMNIACPRKNIEKALNNIKEAIDNI